MSPRVQVLLYAATGAVGVAYYGFGYDLFHRSPPAGATFATCAEARAAGYASLYTTDPGYRPELDDDRDGMACEPRRRRRAKRTPKPDLAARLVAGPRRPASKALAQPLGRPP